MTQSRNPHLVTTVKCAAPGCTNVRREANHWFVTSADQRFTCRPYSATADLRSTDERACGRHVRKSYLKDISLSRSYDNTTQPAKQFFRL